MEIKLPSLGENIDVAEVVEVLVAPGDQVEKEQGIIEIESDKATTDVPSPAAGTVREVKVAVGDSIKVGQVLCLLEDGEESEQREPEEDKEEGDAKPAPSESSEDRQSEESEGGGKESRDASERTTESKTDEGNDEEDDKKTDEGDESSKTKSDDPVESEPRKKTRQATRGGSPVFAAPSVRKFAREIGANLTEVEGSGPGGRISIDDVKRFSRERVESDAGGGSTVVPLPDFSQWGEVERIEMSSVRRKTAEHMSQSWRAPHVTLFELADATQFEDARQRFKELVRKESDASLTVTAMLLKIVAAGLLKHPPIAASVDLKNGELVRKRYCHVGVAVDSPRGLLVPVIRDADSKGMSELSAELAAAAGKARDGKLSADDMRGGVFTLSNLGGLGTRYFTPIVNHPEGAILGVGRARVEAVYDESSEGFVPRRMLPLSLSFDHRMVDGAEAARFLHWLVEAIQDPVRVLL